jgi:two-component system, NarL family, invasion response regulator UvrY
MIKVLIADPHPILNQRLSHVCEDSHDVTVVAKASSAEELLEKVQRDGPDAVIIGLTKPAQLGFADLKELKRRHPQLPAIVLSLYQDDNYALCALEAGASGYLMMEAARDQLIETIRMFVLGGPVVNDRDGQFTAI